MSKNVLIISQYYYPEQFIITSIAESLKMENYDVTVLTGIPNYPLGKRMYNYKNKFYKEYINNVEVIRVPMILRGKGIKMILNYLSYALMASVRTLILSKNYDIVYVFEVSPVTQIFPAYVYKKIKNKKTKIIVNCQDIWPEVLKTYGFDEEHFIFKIGYLISDFLYNKADLILVSSSMFRDYLVDLFRIDTKKIRDLPNFADDWVLNVKNNNSNGKVHLVFAGNLGVTQNLSLIIESVNNCKNKSKIEIDLIGDGSYMTELMNLTKSLELSHIIKFHGRKSIDDLKPFYDNASAFLLTLICDNKVSYTIPSKVQGYMGAGKPIIASIEGGAKRLIQESQCGLLAKYNDVDNFSKVIDDFVDNIDTYRNLGSNGRDYFKKHFLFRDYLSKLIEYMEDKHDAI